MMKDINRTIRGRQYNTASARLVGKSDEGTLYYKRTGEFFLRQGDELIPLSNVKGIMLGTEILGEQGLEKFMNPPVQNDNRNVTTSIPADLHEQFRQYARDNNTTMTNLVVEWLEETV